MTSAGTTDATLSPRPAESVVAANGIDVAFRIQGSGPALLAIMGLGGQLIDWPPELIEELAQHFTVITFDNRDAGLSTAFSSAPPTRKELLRVRLTKKRLTTAEYTLLDMAADARGLLDALGISSAHVMGTSMGGMIAQTLAIVHPERVRSLTSIMSNTGDGKNGLSDPRVTMKMVRQAEPRNAEEAVEASVEQFSWFAGSAWDADVHRAYARLSVKRSFRPQGIPRQLAAILASDDRTPELQRLQVPTLVVHGLQDKLVLPSGGIATAAAIPESRLLMFPDMGHDLPSTRVDELTKAIVGNAARASLV